MDKVDKNHVHKQNNNYTSHSQTTSSRLNTWWCKNPRISGIT